MAIQPTIGRRVWYWPSKDDLTGKKAMFQADPDQAFDAGVTFVAADGKVTLTVADHSGAMHRRESVRLLQDDEVATEGEAHAAWMPYQKQAAEKATEPKSVDVAGGASGNGFVDPKLDAARIFVMARQHASHQALMGRFDISHLHADELLCSLERMGVVGPEVGGTRPVLVKP